MGGFFEYMMWGGALLCFISYGLQDNKEDKGNLYLGIALAAVVLITGTFGYYQSSKSAAIMAQFKNFIPPKAYAIRAGKQQEVVAADLVPGDIVRINTGDNIPADVIILAASEMKVNNSSLTGESEDLARFPRQDK